jgi:hypothetical protein
VVIREAPDRRNPAWFSSLALQNKSTPVRREVTRQNVSGHRDRIAYGNDPAIDQLKKSEKPGPDSDHPRSA